MCLQRKHPSYHISVALLKWISIRLSSGNHRKSFYRIYRISVRSPSTCLSTPRFNFGRCVSGHPKMCICAFTAVWTSKHLILIKILEILHWLLLFLPFWIKIQRASLCLCNPHYGQHGIASITQFSPTGTCPKQLLYWLKLKSAQNQSNKGCGILSFDF